MRSVMSMCNVNKMVWIGNLPEEATINELMELGKQVGTPLYAGKTGANTGFIMFKTAEEAKIAIETFNGAIVGLTNIIEAVAWTRKHPLVGKEQQGLVV